jgi:hypothetical protein
MVLNRYKSAMKSPPCLRPARAGLRAGRSPLFVKEGDRVSPLEKGGGRGIYSARILPSRILRTRSAMAAPSWL